MIHTYDASDESLVRVKPLPVTEDDIVNVGFDANETPSAFAASMKRLDTLADVTVGSTSLSGEIGTVQVSGLTAGVRYRLYGTFTRSNGTKWTRTLIIDCVA